MEEQLNFYRTVSMVLLVALLIFFNISHINFIEVSESNEKLSEELEQQRTTYESYLSNYETEYSTLELKYEQTVKENTQLKEELKNTGVDLPNYEYTEEEIYLLAQCVEAEAGHYKNHENSQQYVAQVILNRLHSNKFPDTIKDVIYQKVNGVPQFSVAWNGMMDREVEPETLANVYSVIVNGTDLPEYVYYFYSSSVTENWVNTLPVYNTVDGTVFAYNK